jgi:hypothetical protein
VRDATDMSARPLQSRPDMSNFTVRRVLLVASMLFCRVALADDAKQPEAPNKLPAAAAKPVSMEEVDKVVEASDRAVQACNKNGRRGDTLAVLMSMTIEADGTVSTVEATPQDQDNGKGETTAGKVRSAADQRWSNAEAACLVRVAKKMKFPAAGTVSHVQYPFMLVPPVKRAPSY